MRKKVIVRLPVLGTHCWPDAHDAQAYLRYPHPHEFTFVVEVPVFGDREVEFHDLRRHLSDEIRHSIANHTEGAGLNFGTMSCEELALAVLRAVHGATAAEVWEDGICGARVEEDDAD